MTTRRQILFSGVGLLTLAACAGKDGALPALPIDIKLPPELVTLISDANAVIAKLKGIQSKLPANVQSIIDKAEAAVADLSKTTSTDAAQPSAASLTSLLDDLVALVPKQTGTTGKIITAIETWLPVLAKVAGVAMMFAARRPTGMSIERAREVLHS